MEKSFFLTEITKADHQLSESFYFIKILYVLTELWIFFYLEWCFLSKKFHFQPKQLWFVVKYPKTSSFFWVLLCRNSSLTKSTDSYSFLLKKYLTFVNLCHITLSLNHSIMYAAVGPKKLANQKRKLLLSMKTLLLLLTKSPSTRKFCFSVCLLSFFCFFRFRFSAYWDHYRKFAGFYSFKPIKKY